MTRNDSVASSKFFSTLSTLTKNGSLIWTRLTPENYRWFEEIVADRSFQADYKGGTIFLLLDEETEENLCQIIPAPGLAPAAYGVPGDSALGRLYEQVRASMPTPLEIYIDSVLSDGYRPSF